MPGITKVLNKFTKQTLVYWQKTGSDLYGKPMYDAPVELKCRWEDREQEVILSDGRKTYSKAYILLGVPVIKGSLVLLGSLTDWQALPTYPDIPSQAQGGREVILLMTTPDIKAASYVYEAYL